MFQILKVIATLTLTVTTGVDCSNQGPQSTAHYCSELKNLFDRDDKIHNHVRQDWVPLPLVVQWGSGDTNRANAALLYVTLKYAHGYRDAVLERGKETLCEVAENFKEYDKVLIHVGAKTLDNDTSCPALVSCKDSRDICTMAGPKLHVMGLAMEPVNPQPYVTLSKQARNNPMCANITWTFTKLLDPLSLPDLEKCDFLHHYPDVSRYSEDWNPTCVNRNCAPILLDFHLNDTYYKDFVKYIAQQIVQKKLPLQLIPSTNYSKCQPPSYSSIYLRMPYNFKPALRVAPATLLQKFAPEIFSVVLKFAPSTKDIKGILKLENSTVKIEELRNEISTQKIEEATCQYFMQHGYNFKDWAIESDPIPWALVLRCKDDQNNHYYGKTSEIVINSTINSFTVNFTDINCSDENAINQQLLRWKNDMRGARMIGIIARGEGALLASKATIMKETQIVLYDVPPDTVNLNNYTRTATGRVKPLSLALKEFFKQNNWRRIAIISDRTQLSEDFTKHLSANSTDIAAKRRFIDDPSATEVLSRFRKEKAHVFFVNMDPKAAGELLCAALNLGMSDYKSYAWIVREWDTRYTAQIPCDIAGITLFSLTYFWRGQKEANFLVETSMLNLTRQINQYINGIWPPLTAPLVDAILLLWYQIETTQQYYPELLNNLHVKENAKKIAESYSRRIHVPGIVQSLKQKDSSLENPLVFIYKWRGGKNCDLLEIWKVDNETVKVNSTIRKAYPDGSAPFDGSSYCITFTSGDPYNPTCYDHVFWAPVAVVAAIIFLVYFGYRHWTKKMEQRDHMMQMRMLARSEHIAAALGPYMVSRSSLDIREELGIGNFGRVHFGMLTFPKRTVPVAVKSLREEASLAEESQFLHEACILSRLSHVNIVRLVGVCAADGPPLVMMEYAFFCDLRRYLTSRRHYAEVKDNEMNAHGVSEALSISPRALTRLAREAAAALDYLYFNKIVHRDVRAANCLIDDNRTLKLADFGMARDIKASKTAENINATIQSNGMIRESYSLRTVSEPMSYTYFCKRRRDMFPVTWMAPESIARGEFSSASDIWSLGVMMFEIVTLGQRPFGSWSPQQVYQYLINGGIPELPLEISYNAREVIEMCWWTEPRKRATAAAIRAHLQANPTALRHAVGAKSANLANTKNRSWSTSDSGYSERRDTVTLRNPCTSTSGSVI